MLICVSSELHLRYKLLLVLRVKKQDYTGIIFLHASYFICICKRRSKNQ